MRRSLAVLAMGPVLMASQCRPVYDLRVAPGPEPGQAVFTGTRKDEAVEIGTVRVGLCRPSVVAHVAWSASRVEKGAGPDSVAYGEGTPRFVAERPPEPLRPGGCYQVFTSGTLHPSGRYAVGSGAFHVHPDGRVANGTGPQGSRLTSYRQVDRVAVGCKRAYRRAPTLQDTVRIDARVWEVSDTTLTCGDLRYQYPEMLASAESTERVLLQAAGGIVGLIALFAIQDKLKLKE
jgi:hypothetical protein